MDVFGRWDAADLNQKEAAELLGVGKRTFRRWCRRYEDEGDLLDRRIGKASGKRVPVDRCEEVARLYRCGSVALATAHRRRDTRQSRANPAIGSAATTGSIIGAVPAAWFARSACEMPSRPEIMSERISCENSPRR